jgi:hypothetical protein
VTSQAEFVQDKAFAAWKTCSWGNDTFLKKNSCLRSLECGTGRICTHYCAIEQWFVFVKGKLLVVLASLASGKQRRVV